MMISEKIILFCDTILLDHLAHFSSNKSEKNLTDFIKQLFDIKYVLEAILMHFRDKSIVKLKSKMIRFFANPAEKLVFCNLTIFTLII